MKYSNIREEELKNRVWSDFFSHFETYEIPWYIDFAVNSREQDLFWKKTTLLRAEAKRGNYNVITMFVQLILTIGKARTFEKTLPPNFLGAFDFQKFAFIEYLAIQDIFYENDFNWNVAPSNHETREFKLVLQRVEKILKEKSLIFDYEKDENRLRDFIKLNITSAKSNAKIKITKNNFRAIFQRRLEAIKPTIKADREDLKKYNIFDLDFFLADIFVDDNNTSNIQDDQNIQDDLLVIFNNGFYSITKGKHKELRLDSVIFLNNQSQYETFWKNYKRPPVKDAQTFILERKDLLIHQDIRERKGAYFTPRIWVEKSQEYMANYFWENYQEEYYIRDCAAGTGNLLAGLTNKYNIYASTLETSDIQVMKGMVHAWTANLLQDHIFQFDFLNDEFIPKSKGGKLPDSLYQIINDPEKRKKLILYINPPYAETATNKTTQEGRLNKRGVSFTEVQKKYNKEIWIATKELFAQFLYRIYKEIPNCKIANFSTLKNLQGANFEQFRKSFLAKLEKFFLVPWNTFDNVKGQFPIWFFIRNCEEKEYFNSKHWDIFNKIGDFIGEKYIFASKKNKFLTDWYKQYHTRLDWENIIGAIGLYWSDFQHNNFIRITEAKNHPNRYTFISTENLKATGVYFWVRHCILADWLNDRDQFLRPNENWKTDLEFQSDCLIFTLFHGQNRISCQEWVNHRIPFTEAEVDAKERFESHFMSRYLQNLMFSSEAQKVCEAGKELWTYYHETANKEDYLANASLYDIREYFQGRNEKWKMNNKSEDATYNELITKLRSELKNLASKIAEKVYEYEFLKR